MIKAIIADDEKYARQRLKELLDSFDIFDILSEASTGSEVLEMIITHKPDVAFLDINMPGVPVFNTISSLADPPMIVFQTAYSEHAAEAFNVNAVDFLTKPISRERLEQTVEKIKAELQKNTDRITESKSGSKTDPNNDDFKIENESESGQVEKITVKVRGAVRIIQVKDIRRICFEDGLSFIYTEKDRFLSDKFLNYYEEKLGPTGFFRASRSNLINIEYIDSIHKMFKGTYLIELKDKTRVDLSRRKAADLKKLIDF